MQAAGVSRRPWWTRERPDRALMIDAARFAVLAIAIVLAAAASVWALAPASWQSLIVDEQRTDATAQTVISIWTNNVLICCLPLLAGYSPTASSTAAAAAGRASSSPSRRSV